MPGIDLSEQSIKMPACLKLISGWRRQDTHNKAKFLKVIKKLGRRFCVLEMAISETCSPLPASIAVPWLGSTVLASVPSVEGSLKAFIIAVTYCLGWPARPLPFSPPDLCFSLGFASPQRPTFGLSSLSFSREFTENLFLNVFHV